GELYAWWLASPLAADSYPASLAVWHRSGEPAAEIRLATVDLPPSLLAALVRSPETARGPRVERLERSPGVHYVLVAPLAGGGVLTVRVGPRTRLIPLARFARFLHGEASGLPPCGVALAAPAPPPSPPSPPPPSDAPCWGSATGSTRISGSTATACSRPLRPRCSPSSAWSIRFSQPTRSCAWLCATSWSAPTTVGWRVARSASA